MCIACIEYYKGKFGAQEYLDALKELHGQKSEHYQDALKKILPPNSQGHDLSNTPTPHAQLQAGNLHNGHNIVASHALGKKFYYCRDCKKEVAKTNV